MNFYSYKYHEVMQLDLPTYNYLMECMIKAKANLDLEAIEIVSYPHLKDSKTRNKARNAIIRKAETEDQLEKRVVTADEIQGFGIKLGSIADHIKDR